MKKLKFKLYGIFRKFFKKNKTAKNVVKKQSTFFRRVINLDSNHCRVGQKFLVKGNAELMFGDNAQGSSVIIGDNVELKNIKINIKGSGCQIHIADNVRFSGHILAAGNNRTVTIGENTTAVGVYILAREKDIHIGKDCMLSREIEIRATDVHKIYEIEGNKRLNTPADVIIGNKVWVGARVFISKGVSIPDGCIIGACSFVNKKFVERNCIIAGNPARVVKQDIRWER